MCSNNIYIYIYDNILYLTTYLEMTSVIFFYYKCVTLKIKMFEILFIYFDFLDKSIISLQIFPPTWRMENNIKQQIKCSNISARMKVVGTNHGCKT